jgi:hypothetical protein
MNIQELQRLRSEKPFRPFRVLTSDGRSYNVVHPEVLGQTPSGRIITIGLSDDSTVSLDLLHISAIRRRIRTSRKGSRHKP